jgi:hypothetical protein
MAREMCCAKGHRRALRGRYGDVAGYLISVIGTSAKWITRVATEPKSRP